MGKAEIDRYNEIINKHSLDGRAKMHRRATTIRMREKTMNEFNRCCGTFFNKTMTEVIEALAEDFIRQHRGEEFYQNEILMLDETAKQLNLPGFQEEKKAEGEDGWIPQSAQA